MSELASRLQRLSVKKSRLDAARPLLPSLLDRMRERMDVEWTYHSNAIEGNTLTLRETQLVLQHGLTVGGKSLREHLEAINHQHSIHYIEALADKESPITEHVMRSIHALVLRTIDDEGAGSYRRVQVHITGSEYVPPEPAAVPGLMADFGAWLRADEAAVLHPVRLAALAHFRLVHIHPFIDGNGRTARLLMNLLLMREGYPPAIIRVGERGAYYSALDAAHEGNTDQFVAMVADVEERALNQWLEAAGVKSEELE